MPDLFTTAEVDQLHDLRKALGVPPDTRETPAQALELLRLAPQALGEKLILRWQQQAEEATTCWVQSHPRQIRELRQRALVAEGRAGVDYVAVAREERERRTAHGRALVHLADVAWRRRAARYAGASAVAGAVVGWWVARRG